MVPDPESTDPSAEDESTTFPAARTDDDAAAAESPPVEGNAPRPLTEVRWDDLRVELASTIQLALSRLVEGAANDLHVYATRISDRAVQAMQANRQDLLEEMQNQARALAEANRLRAVNGYWDAVNAVIVTAIRASAKALLTAGALV